MTFTINLPPWCWIVLTLSVAAVSVTRTVINIYKVKHLKRGLKEPWRK